MTETIQTQKTSIKGILLLTNENTKDWKDIDLVGYDGPGYYFWEDKSFLAGPFSTLKEAKENRKNFIFRAQARYFSIILYSFFTPSFLTAYVESSII